MRLTLRTLLAFLDNMLDPQDAELLQSKLAESGFATQLVQRIRDVLTRSDLSAPSPLAKGPVEDANVICEYLDSTLPVEQVAEVERACLDSDSHLAEAAACHQILTMALGNPANVAVRLRDRIYHLPGETKEARGSFSALDIPEQVNSFDAVPGGIPPAEVPPVSQERVRPVSVGDSGVMQAPARLRQREFEDHKAAKAGPAIAGSRPRDPNADVYGGRIRPSRVAPWLVTLGLAAVLLYALTQIFQPLLRPQTTAENKSVAASTVDPGTDREEENGGTGESTRAGVDATARAKDATDPRVSEIETDAIDSPTAVNGEVPTAAPPPSPEVGDSTQENPTADPGTVTSDATGVPVPAEEMPVATDETNDGAVPAVPEANVKQPNPDGVPPPPPPMTRDAADVAATTNAAEPPAEAEPAMPVLGTVLSDGTLIAMETDQQWVRLGKDAEVVADRPVVVAPGFRARVAIRDSVVTFIGPVSASLVAGEGTHPIIRLRSGRMLVSVVKPDEQVHLQLGDKKCELEFTDVDSVAAVSVRHTREPGFDPLKLENHVVVRDVIAAQGGITLTQAGAVQALQANGEWTQVGMGEPTVMTLDPIPDWAAIPAVEDNALDLTARADLLALLDGAASLEIALRESLSFRRSEVAALAAMTLLVLGRSDVYFGGTGIFNEPKQRVYWPKHYDMLLSQVNLDVASAGEIQQAIHKMDSASEVSIFGMLTGYTDKQLESGSDLKLLEFLDSSDMSVRVLAFENLNRITGVTLNYRAEQENQGRRSQTVKKWQVLQRKGEIRWKK